MFEDCPIQMKQKPLLSHVNLRTSCSGCHRAAEVTKVVNLNKDCLWLFKASSTEIYFLGSEGMMK